MQIPDDASELLTSPSVPELVGSGRSNLRRSAVGALLTALVATLAIGGAPSWAAYTASAPNTGNSLAAATYYSCTNATMAGSPYLVWKFDETTGTSAADSSGNGRPEPTGPPAHRTPPHPVMPAGPPPSTAPPSW